jgi:hypothetical protein
MRLTEMVPSAPIQVARSIRRDRGRVLTSGDAGKILPLKYMPMLREDAVRRGRVRVNLEMMETAELLMNGITVNVMAHYVPFLAFERFNGSMEELNRSYKGEPGIGGSVVPFFEKNKYYNPSTGVVVTVSDSESPTWDTVTSGVYYTSGIPKFYQTMGMHFQGPINTAVVEAYNAIVNHRRKARSASLPLRNAWDHTLAEAFWSLDNNHIVPDFDQKLIDGEVALSGLTFQAPIHARYQNNESIGRRDATIDTAYPDKTFPEGNAVREGSEYVWQDVYAELTAGGNAKMSLADIEQAKKTAAFAKLRSLYDGIDDEYIIDLLMSGIRVPEEAMKQPILLARQQTMIGYRQRFATDAANLDESVTNGFATVDLNIRTPGNMNTGGVILITCEIVPEQMWERKKDYFLYETNPDNLPNYLRDYLDPEKVDVVQNDHLDVNHSQPDGTFGYAPLNHQWQRDMVNVGGKYYRPANDAFDEDRQKIWTVETTDPTLSEDFYLVSALHKKVFADQVADSFEITCLSDLEISGNTVFGERLIEADTTSDYEAITNLVDTARIDK